MRILCTKALAIIALVGLISCQQAVDNTQSQCIDAPTLQLFNFTRISPQVINNGTCREVYSNGGSCVSLTQTMDELRKKYDWLKQRAIDAKHYNMQRANASLYFQVRNGQMTKLEAQARLNMNSSKLKTLTSTVTVLVASVAEKLGDMFGGLPEWMKRNFDLANNQINPCFQAIQNLTDASICVLTSANKFGRIPNPLFNQDPRVPSYLLKANVRSAGQLLRQCNSLVDTYCSLTYGISVMTASKPYNMTFNWNDNSGISERICTAMAGYINSTNSGEMSALDSIYVDMFHTAWVRFVPSKEAIANLGAFLTNKEFDKDPKDFTPIVQSPLSIGLGISSQNNVEVEVDLVQLAKTSGAPVHTYSTGRFTVAAVMTLFAFIMA